MTFDELKGVEELVERMRQAPDRLWMADLVGQKISIERMRDILAFALAQQPAAVADATVARLTKDQRTRLVEKLVADQVEGADRLSSYLWDVLKNGFRGYSNYTDQELLDAHWDAFDEDFFGLEYRYEEEKSEQGQKLQSVPARLEGADD